MPEQGSLCCSEWEEPQTLDSEDCEEMAVLGTRPAEDTTLASEGTLFSHSTQSLGGAVLGLVLPEVYKSWSQGWTREPLQACSTPG